MTILGPNRLRVALNKNQLEELLLSTYRKNGASLTLRKKLFQGVILRETRGAHREGMVSILEEENMAIISMPPFFQRPISEMLKNNGIQAIPMT